MTKTTSSYHLAYTRLIIHVDCTAFAGSDLAVAMAVDTMVVTIVLAAFLRMRPGTEC